LEGTRGDFPTDGVWRGEEDGIGGVIHDHFYTGEGLQGTDISPFPADDAALMLITL
jgi:hypothetical protein